MLRSLVLLAAFVGVTATVSAQEVNVIWEQCGMDFYGGDVGSEKSENPDACPLMCYGRRGCERVTWTNYEGGTCWYKGWDVRFKPSANAVSYHWTYEPNPSVGTVNRFDTKSNMDMVGYDIGSVRGANIDICYGLCGLSNSCWAVVWTDYQGGTCWLKSRASAYVSRPGAQSTILTRKLNELTYTKCKP